MLKLDKIKQTHFFNRLDKLEALTKVLIITIMIEGIVILMLLFALTQSLGVSKVIVLPPKVDKEFWVTGTTLSASYYEQVGFYIADRVLSLSPKTAESSFDTLLPFFGSNSKEIYPVKKMLKEQADFIKKENVYQMFYPLTVIPDAKEGILMVNGMLRKFIGSTYIHEVNARLNIKFNVENGRFIIKNLEVK